MLVKNKQVKQNQPQTWGRAGTNAQVCGEVEGENSYFGVVYQAQDWPVWSVHGFWDIDAVPSMMVFDPGQVYRGQKYKILGMEMVKSVELEWFGYI